jgi:hypothetical protein
MTEKAGSRESQGHQIPGNHPPFFSYPISCSRAFANSSILTGLFSEIF